MKAEMENGMTEAADNYSKLVGAEVWLLLKPVFFVFFRSTRGANHWGIPNDNKLKCDHFPK